MKAFVIAIAAMIIWCAPCFADKVVLPMSCYPKEIQKKFAENGIHIDLSPNDRTEKSWGFLVSEGTRFYINTYEPLRVPDDLELIKKIIMEK